MFSHLRPLRKYRDLHRCREQPIFHETAQASFLVWLNLSSLKYKESSSCITENTVLITNTNYLITVYRENHTKHTQTVHGHNAEFLYVKANGARPSLVAVKGLLHVLSGITLKFCTLSTEFTYRYVFSTIITISSDYFPKQHWQLTVLHATVCETTWIQTITTVNWFWTHLITFRCTTVSFTTILASYSTNYKSVNAHYTLRYKQHCI